MQVDAWLVADKHIKVRGKARDEPLWQAMETGAPLVVLEAQPEASQASISNKQSFATRRTRKQLLHRLSKQPVAAQYAWEALTVGAEQGPTVEEGWSRILTV